MVGGPAVADVEGLLLLLVSRILGRRATLVCLWTNTLFSITRSASRILRLFAPSAKRTNRASKTPSHRRTLWTTLCSATASAFSIITRYTSGIISRAFRPSPTALQTPSMGDADAVPSTKHQTLPRGEAVGPFHQPRRQQRHLRDHAPSGDRRNNSEPPPPHSTSLHPCTTQWDHTSSGSGATPTPGKIHGS